jgi:hypothetical protein
MRPTGTNPKRPLEAWNLIMGDGTATANSMRPHSLKGPVPACSSCHCYTNKSVSETTKGHPLGRVNPKAKKKKIHMPLDQHFYFGG